LEKEQNALQPTDKVFVACAARTMKTQLNETVKFTRSWFFLWDLRWNWLFFRVPHTSCFHRPFWLLV